MGVIVINKRGWDPADYGSDKDRTPVSHLHISFSDATTVVGRN